MKLLKNKIKNNEKGNSLVVVIGVMAIVFILIMSALASVTTSQTQTLADYNSRQAYFSCRSAINTLTDCINESDDLKLTLNNMSANSSIYTKISLPDAGDVNIEIKRSYEGDDSQYVIIGNSEYRSGTSTVKAVIKLVPSPVYKGFDSAITANNTTLSNEFKAGGDIVVKYPDSIKVNNGYVNIENATSEQMEAAEFTINNPNTVNGRMYSYSSLILGDLEINTGNATQEFYIASMKNITFPMHVNKFNRDPNIIDAYIVAGKNMNITQGDCMIGNATNRLDLYTDGIRIAGGAKIYGDVYIYDNYDGTGNPLSGNVYIYGNLYSKGNLRINSQLNVYGNVFTEGDIIGNVNITKSGCSVHSSSSLGASYNGPQPIVENISIPTKKTIEDPKEKFRMLDPTQFTTADFVDDSKFIPIESSGSIINLNNSSGVVINGNSTPSYYVLKPKTNTNESSPVTINVGKAPIYIKLIPGTGMDMINITKDIKIIRNADSEFTPVVIFAEDTQIIMKEQAIIADNRLFDFNTRQINMQYLCGGSYDSTNITPGSSNFIVLKGTGTLTYNDSGVIGTGIDVASPYSGIIGYVYIPNGALRVASNNCLPFHFNYSYGQVDESNNIKYNACKAPIIGSAVVQHGYFDNSSCVVFLPLSSTIGTGGNDTNCFWEVIKYGQ